jgi:hypothetical protein
MIGLFWEESTFRNKPQYGLNCTQAGPAIGFGQVEPAGFRPYKALTNKPPFQHLEAILGHDLWSAQLPMRLLHYLYTENPGSGDKMKALKAYGTACGSQSRIRKIQGWLT